MRRILTSISIGILSVGLFGCSNTVEKENLKGNKEIVEKEAVEKKEECPIAKEQEEYDYFLKHYNKPKKLLTSFEKDSVGGVIYSDKYFVIKRVQLKDTDKDSQKRTAYIYDYDYNLIETFERDRTFSMMMNIDSKEDSNTIYLIKDNRSQGSFQIYRKIIGSKSEPKLCFEIPCSENEYILPKKWTKKGLFFEKSIDEYKSVGIDKLRKNYLCLLDNRKTITKIMEYDEGTYIKDIKDDWFLMERKIKKDDKDYFEIFRYNFKTKEKVDLPVLSYLRHVRNGSLYGEFSVDRRLEYKFFNSVENFLAVEALVSDRYWVDYRILILGSEYPLYSVKGVFLGFVKDGFAYIANDSKKKEESFPNLYEEDKFDLYVVKRDSSNKEISK